jgi:hypothetical protein
MTISYGFAGIAGWERRTAAFGLVAVLAGCASAPPRRPDADARPEPLLTLTARADRDTLAPGDTLRVWATLRNAGPRPVGVRYTSSCRFALRLRARAGGGTLVPGRACLLDLVVGSLAPGDSLSDTLRWAGGWGDQTGMRPPPPRIPGGEYDVVVAYTVDVCTSGREATGLASPGCAREVTSAPLRLTVVAPRDAK